MVAQETGAALREMGLRPYLKTSGQMGLHVMVGLKPKYTYEQARMFSEVIARLVVKRIPDLATINRNPRSRAGQGLYRLPATRSRQDYRGDHSAVRPISGAPVSAPLDWKELKPTLDPARIQYQDHAQADGQMRGDPFLGALDDPMTLEDALPALESALQSPRA